MGYGVHRVEEKSPCGRFVRYSDVLGRGAFKEVYLGFDYIQKIDIAWNQTVFHGEDGEALLKIPEKLFIEAILLHYLNHERVMKCFSYWFDFESKTLNIITELFLSGSLNKHMLKCNNGNCVDPGNSKTWGRQILEGLSFLHGQNPKIIHGDIKCDNIFVHGGGKEVKLGDFGLAVRLMEGDFAKEVKGTPQFMAPEYYDNEYDECVDIYAFGMCLLEMLTGEYPYMECSNSGQIFRKVYITSEKPASLVVLGILRVWIWCDDCNMISHVLV